MNKPYSIYRPTAAKHCDLCRGTSFETIATRDRRGDDLETVICSTCGLVCHAHVPTDAELAAFYAHEYRQSYHGESTPSARRVVRAWRNGERLVKRLGPLVSPQDNILEIGAGIGCTVKQFELAGFSARGTEPHDGFQQYSREQLHASVAHASIDDVPLDRSHRLVLLVHVIEHFGSPRAALERIHGMLQKDGLLYVECPNVGAPFAPKDRLFHQAHTFNFTASSLIMLARACGFEPVEEFTVGRDANLEILFRKTATRHLSIDPENRERTLNAIQNATAIRYHSRLSYLSGRIRQVARYLHEHATAERDVRGILAACKATQNRPSMPTVARRAA